MIRIAIKDQPCWDKTIRLGNIQSAWSQLIALMRAGTPYSASPINRPISSTLFVDIQKISLKELSSSVIFDIDIDFSLDIHRIDVDLGIEGLETSQFLLI